MGSAAAYVCPDCLGVVFDGGILCDPRGVADVGRFISQAVESIRRENFNDPLTQVRNRKFFLNRLGAEIKTARHRSFISVLAFAVNIESLYKSVGSRSGDTIIQGIATSLLNAVRIGDDLARVDDGVFGMILRNADEHAAYAAAERISQTIGDMFYDHVGDKLKVEIRITVVDATGLTAERAWEKITRIFEAER